MTRNYTIVQRINRAGNPYWTVLEILPAAARHDGGTMCALRGERFGASADAVRAWRAWTENQTVLLSFLGLHTEMHILEVSR